MEKHWPVIFGRRGGRRFELAENLFVQPRPRLGRGNTGQAEMAGQRRTEQHATVGKRQHADQLPAIGIQATRHQLEGGRNVLLGQRSAADVIRHLIVIGLDLLDQQDQPGVVQRLAQIAQLLDIVNPTAVVPDHYYA